MTPTWREGGGEVKSDAEKEMERTQKEVRKLIEKLKKAQEEADKAWTDYCNESYSNYPTPKALSK